MTRLHDLDALRACAMLLGVLLHAVFHTIPWRYFRYPVVPGGPNVWALPYFHAVQLIHGLRMPVFFLLSGFFCALLLQRRGLKGLLKNRVLRIALPLLICIPTIRNLEFIINRLTRGDNPTTAEWFDAAVVSDLSNLWFLWQLLLLSALFMLLARLGLRFRHSLCWLLLPLAWLPAYHMDQEFLVFGPETSVAVLVDIEVLGFYACFYFFGVFFYQRGYSVRRWWMLAILPAVAFVYPLAIPLLFVHERLRDAAMQLQGSLLETIFAWLMCFGLMGLFHAVAARERPWVRLLADAAYWIYLTHELLMQVLARHIRALAPNPHLFFPTLVLLVSGLLLLAWTREVRYSWFGTLLNGKRERHAAENVPTPLGSPAPLSVEVDDGRRSQAAV